MAKDICWNSIAEETFRNGVKLIPIHLQARKPRKQQKTNTSWIFNFLNNRAIGIGNMMNAKEKLLASPIIKTQKTLMKKL